MKKSIKIYILIHLLVLLFTSGCARQGPLQVSSFLIQNIPGPEAQIGLKKSFISALDNTGDIIGSEIYREKAVKFYDTRTLGSEGIVFLYKKDPERHNNSIKSRFAYVILRVPQDTHINLFRNNTSKNLQFMWALEFNGNNAGWVTGYSDKEPFFSISTMQLDDKHKLHNKYLYFKSQENMKLFLNSLLSLYPYITYH